MNCLKLAQEITGLNEKDAETAIWELTGFPGFWPDDSKTPEENFRAQLQKVREGLDAGITLEMQLKQSYAGMDAAMEKCDVK